MLCSTCNGGPPSKKRWGHGSKVWVAEPYTSKGQLAAARKHVATASHIQAATQPKAIDPKKAKLQGDANLRHIKALVWVRKNNLSSNMLLPTARLLEEMGAYDGLPVPPKNASSEPWQIREELDTAIAEECRARRIKGMKASAAVACLEPFKTDSARIRQD